jgi:phosphoglycolate phosphatase
MVRCVAFDFDGTLVDSNTIKRAAYSEVARAFRGGEGAVRKALRQRPGGDRHEVCAAIASELASQGAAPAELDAAGFAHSLATAYTRYCERAVVECDEVPGAREALEALAARPLPLYINTATPTTAALPILEQRGMKHYFQGVFGGPGSKLENLAVIAQREEIEPDALLFVGDGEDDRRAAAALACDFVGIATCGRGRFLESPPRCLADLRGLADLVAKLCETET